MTWPWKLRCLLALVEVWLDQELGEPVRRGLADVDGAAV